jgi:transcription initiation factor IIE alpha subunit
MRAESQKPGEEIDQSKLGRALKMTDATGTTDDVSGHLVPVTYPCPHCNAPLYLEIDYDLEWFQCPVCGSYFRIII